MGWLTVIFVMVGDNGVQADMVLEKEQRVEKELYLDPTGKEVICLIGYSLCIGDLKAHSDTFLQQGHPSL